MILTRDAQPDSAIRAADRAGIGVGQEAVVLATVGASGSAESFAGVHSCSAKYEVVAKKALAPEEPKGWLEQLWSIGRSDGTKPKITYGGIPVPDDLPSVSLLRMAALFRRNADGSLWVSPPFSLAYFEVPEEVEHQFNKAGGAMNIVQAMNLGDMADTFRRVGVQTKRNRMWADDQAVRVSGFRSDAFKDYSEMAIGR